MSKDRVAQYIKIMEHHNPIIQGWMRGYKMKNINYTQALEFAVLDLAEQQFIMLKQIATHHEICPYGSKNYVVRPPDDIKPGKIIYPEGHGYGLVWITVAIVFAALFLAVIADKAGLI